jgi:hypothetical protein
MIRTTALRGVFTTLLTTILTVSNVLYSWWFSVRLYEWSGGIQRLPSGWIQFGGAPCAWAIPLHLPGPAMLRFCQIYSGSDCASTLVAQLSFLVLLVGSVVPAYLVSAALIAFITRRQISWGRWYWRAVVILLGLAWIPVREDFAPVF